MELKKSAIGETWKMLSLGGFLALFLVALLLTNNPQTVDVTNVRTTVVSFITNSQQQPPTTTISATSPPPPVSLASRKEADLSGSGGDVEYKIPTNETSTNTNNTSTSTNTSAMGVDFSSNISSSNGTMQGPARLNKCKMYEGRWVYKPEENPRYQVRQCSFLEEKMSCQRNGRPDSRYEGWSWESDDNDCHIPLFNGLDMLERLRGKRVILVGDSLNRNMWESLACLLYTSLPSPHRALVDAAGDLYKVFQAKDYNFTLEFHWAPFMVQLDEKHKSGKKVLSLDHLQPSSERWRGADVMLFNSGHWWTHLGKFRSWDVFEYKGEQLKEMQTEVAYERALTTWAKWLARNVDPIKTKVYFRSISTEHKKAEQWCYNASRPITNGSYVQLYPQSMIDVVEGKIKEMNGRDGVHVSYLNITKLSGYRVDAHPSIYRFKDGNDVVMEESVLKVRADCSHWCLPGLPDTWNRIFYASLFFDHLSPGQVD